MKSYRELAPLARSLRGIFCDRRRHAHARRIAVPAAYDALVRATEAGLRVVAVTGRAGRMGRGVRLHLARSPGHRRERRLRRAPRTVGQGRRAHDWDDAATCSAQGSASPPSPTRSSATFPARASPTISGCAAATSPSTSARPNSCPAPASTPSASASAARRALVTSSVHAHAYFGDHDKAACASRVAAAWWQEDLAATRREWLFVGDRERQACLPISPCCRRSQRAPLLDASPAAGLRRDAEGGGQILLPPRGGDALAHAGLVVIAEIGVRVHRR